MNSTQRKEFAEFLERLAKNKLRPHEWHRRIITHYFDEQLELIRREVSRLGGDFALHTPRDQQKLAEWRKLLLEQDTE
jgi:hypothetical protein